ncbi:MAG: hypothetical protein K2O29_10090 [Ruminococcus sp.]|nr:hypothetical protein [Ruminococcus sp.]MDE7138785.1 hypothetical protein [Ruminococcus sp.]
MVVDGISSENNVEGFKYKGREYTYTRLYIADMDKKHMGVEKNYHSRVYFDNTDIVIVSGRDNTSIYKADDYEIKTDVTITKVIIEPNYRDPNDTVLYKEKDIDMINKLISVNGKTQAYELENFYTHGNVLCFEYDGCLAADPQVKCGYIAKINDKWIYVSLENQENIKISDDNSVVFYGVEINDSEIISWIEKSDISKGLNY